MSFTPIDPRSLRAGQRLAQPLFNRHGVKLLSAGNVLTEDICRTLRKVKRGDLFLARSLSALRDDRVIEATSQVDVGHIAPSDIVTAGGVLAVEQGDEVELHHADAYSLGAFQGRERRETHRLRANRIRLADQHISELGQTWERLPLRIARSPDALDVSAMHQPGWPDPAHLVAYRDERVQVFRQIFARVLAGVPVDVNEPLELVDDLIGKLQKYPEKYTQIALLGHRNEDYLPDHCFASACLSIAIAARMGWAISHVREAGLAGLLADVGMGLVPRELRQSSRPLDDSELNRVFRHPAHSVVLLEAVEGLPESVRLAVFQHHERNNGSGYPNKIRGKHISDLAHVVSVADTFAAASQARAFRPRKRPYEALEELIKLGSDKVFDRRFVRPLVLSTGLFPVGSYVRLNTGDVALVVGAYADQIDRPIVCVPHSTEPGSSSLGRLMDLTEHEPWELHVLMPADAPGNTSTQIRRRASA